MNPFHLSKQFIALALMGLLTAGTVSAKKIQQSVRSTFCPDLSTIGIPDSVQIFTPFAEGKALIRVYSNDAGIRVQLVAADDATQQKWLFNGLTVYIDPTGKGKDKYAMIFPSAMSLGRQSGGLSMGDGLQPPPPETGGEQDLSGSPARPDTLRGPHPPRPGHDVSAVVQKMNLKGATLDIDGDTRFAGTSIARVTLTPDRRMCYNVTMPYEIFEIKNLKPDAVSVGILSEFVLPQGMSGSGGGMDGGPGGGGMGGPGGGMGGPGGGGPGGGMGGGPGGGMGHRGGGMGFGSSGQSGPTVSADLKRPVKGWIQVIINQ
jgi:hypothetical protein